MVLNHGNDMQVFDGIQEGRRRVDIGRSVMGFLEDDLHAHGLSKPRCSDGFLK